MTMRVCVCVCVHFSYACTHVYVCVGERRNTLLICDYIMFPFSFFGWWCINAGDVMELLHSPSLYFFCTAYVDWASKYLCELG